ncbi:hypothetical protein EV702DRAFT_985985 [Suillus placidus]|uniref:Uncharacterized protein n=1 Tax=Suillus placidus TaxID=48579 RepID=A0A9P6ZFG1_9AGAM|nr:hypothetical protein EV702DRAFT_985985 [Suillus placidus]
MEESSRSSFPEPYFLKTQVESWFAVFFNIFGSMDRDNHGMVDDVISVWVGLAEKQDIAKPITRLSTFSNKASNNLVGLYQSLQTS